MSENLTRLLADVKQWPDHKVVDGAHDPNFCVRCIREWRIIPDLEKEIERFRLEVQRLEQALQPFADAANEAMMRKLTSAEKQYLRRRICKWCDQTLWPMCCGSIHEPACSKAELSQRIEQCLNERK